MSVSDEGFATEEIDTSRAHTARVYDYWLGGKNNYEVDAAMAERVAQVWPGVRRAARLNRDFMHRAVRWLTAQAGVRQFLDIGSGIPTEPNLHQVAQRVAPDSRVVYTDHDPIVLRYSEALLTSTPEGRTAYVHGDVRDPESILTSKALRDTLDLSRPVALCLNALLHFIPDSRRPREILRRLLDAVPSDSYLVLTHATADFDPDLLERVSRVYGASAEGQLRSREEVLALLDGLELVSPGLVPSRNWRPDSESERTRHTDADCGSWVAVARKP